MKPLGSDPGLGGLSPGKGTLDYGWTIKEKGLGDMLSLVPEPGSPKTTKDHRIKDWSKSILDDKQEISEASLSEGFTFPLREPPRPGQFTNITRHSLFTKPFDSQPPESCQNLPGLPPKDRITGPLARASPLDLPELCLPGKPSNIDSIHEHKGDSEISQQFRPVSWLEFNNLFL